MDTGIKQIKYGAIITYITMFLGLIINLVFTPIIIRILGQSEYGLYNLSASIISYLGILNFGFGSTYIRYYAKFKVNFEDEKISILNGMFMIIFSVIALLSLFIGTIIILNINLILGARLTLNELYIAKILIIILCLNLTINFPGIIFTSYINANQKFIFMKLVSLIKTITSPCAIIIILYFGYGSIGMALATTFVNLFIEIIYIFYAKKRLKINFKFKYFDKKLFKEMTIFSFFIFINILTDQINWNVDKYLIGVFRGTNAVAIYSIASLINNHYLQLSTAISNLYAPRIHILINSEENGDIITKLFTKVGRIQFIILSLFLSGFIFFGKPFIIWWVGKSYLKAYYIIIILISSVTIPIIQNLGIEIQRAKNLHKFRSIIYLLIAVLNIIISIPLVNKYGEVGAALGTSIALIIGNILIMNIYYQKKVNINMVYFWKNIFKLFPSFIIPVIGGLIILQIINIYYIFLFILGICLYSILYCLSIWVLGMNKYEKILIKNFLLNTYKYVLRRIK